MPPTFDSDDVTTDLSILGLPIRYLLLPYADLRQLVATLVNPFVVHLGD